MRNDRCCLLRRLEYDRIIERCLIYCEVLMKSTLWVRCHRIFCLPSNAKSSWREDELTPSRNFPGQIAYARLPVEEKECNLLYKIKRFSCLSILCFRSSSDSEARRMNISMMSLVWRSLQYGVNSV
jgi:hypothetical protein